VVQFEASFESDYNAPMKYSLRSLMIVVTLVCVLAGGRIEYLRRMAAYHDREATNCLLLDLNEQLSLSEKLAIESDFHNHTVLCKRYKAAIYRPWLMVDTVSTSSAAAPKPPNR